MRMPRRVLALLLSIPVLALLSLPMSGEAKPAKKPAPHSHKKKPHGASRESALKQKRKPGPRSDTNIVGAANRPRNAHSAPDDGLMAHHPDTLDLHPALHKKDAQ